MKRVIVGCLIAFGCKGKAKDKAPEAPPKPVVVDATAAAAVIDAAPEAVATPTPKTKHGLIVFTSFKGDRSEPEPLQLVDPDDGKVTEGPVKQAGDLVVGPHLIAGLDRTIKDKPGVHFVVDLRGPTLVAKPASQPTEGITPDDILVTRCKGGVGQPFALCTSKDGGMWSNLFEEPAAKGQYDVAAIASVGKDVVHADYGQLSKVPPFSIRISDKKRTDYPKIIRKTKDGMLEVFYSPNGTKTATCGKDLVVTTLDGGKAQTIKLDSEPVRCTCKFSHDDTKLGCSILYEAKESGFESLWLFELATNKKTMLAKEVAIGSFIWSPDDTQLAYVGTAPKQWVLRVTSLDGKTARDLANNALETHLFELAGWTSP